MHILSVPLVETLADCPAVRNGPHVVPPTVLRGVLPPVRWAAYWYRDHGRCAEYDCRCHRSRVRGDGRCVVSYGNGLFGCFDLVRYGGEDLVSLASTAGSSPAPWNEIRAASFCIDGAVYPDLVQHEAVAGLRQAVEHARLLGWFDEPQEVAPPRSVPHTRRPRRAASTDGTPSSPATHRRRTKSPNV